MRTTTTQAKPKAASEDQIQKSIIQTLDRTKINGIAISAYVHHSPNGGTRASKISDKGKRYSPEAQKLKAMGMQAGFPDLFFFKPMGGYHGLFVELKKPKKNKIIELITDNHKPDRSEATDNQVKTISDLNDQGYLAVVAYGYDAAIEIIKDYFHGRKTRPIVREPVKSKDGVIYL